MGFSASPPSRMPLATDSFWDRLCHTPLFDVIRGKIAGQLDARRVIASADLGEELSAIVWHVVRKTGLWRSEKLDVASELASHFRDGLDGGQSAEELIAGFGDVSVAIQLIRRAKLRSRAWPYRLWRRTWQTASILTATILLLYAVIAIRFYSGRPTVTQNYLANIQAGVHQIPEADRAWPLYRQALIGLKRPVKTTKILLAEAQKGANNRFSPSANPTIVTYVSENQDALQLVRKAAEAKRLGLRFDDPADKPWMAIASGSLDQDVLQFQTAISKNELALMGMPLPHLLELDRLGDLLSWDIVLAIDSGDTQRIKQDIHAMIGIAKQLQSEDLPLVTINFYSHGMFERAVNNALTTMTLKPDLFSAEDLHEIRDTLSSYHMLSIREQLKGIRMMAQDTIQRSFTDDGSGNGRLTSEGFFLLVHQRDGRALYNQEDDFTEMTLQTILPVFGTMVVNRRETATRIDEILNRIEEQGDSPRWTWTNRDPYNPLATQAEQSKLTLLRYMPAYILTSGLDRLPLTRELCVQHRDAALYAIALELFRREHGDYPAKLNELVPTYLPELLPDRMTGEPPRYKMTPHGPLLYSVGHNLVDDDGKIERFFPAYRSSMKDDIRLWAPFPTTVDEE